MLSWGVKVAVSSLPLSDIAADGLAIGFFEGDKVESVAAPDVIVRAAGRLFDLGDFAGKVGQSAVIYPEGLKTPRVVLVGLGKAEDFTADKARKAAGTAATRLRDLGAKHVALSAPIAPLKLDVGQAAAAAVEGAILGLYQHVEFRTEKRDEIKEVTGLTVVVGNGGAEAANRGAHDAQAVAEAVCWIRTMINRPGGTLTPDVFACEASGMAGEFGLGCRILGLEELRELGMGCLLGVNAGSADPPRLIVLTYNGAGDGSPPLALVGKGITFDTGGLCIKNRAGMEQMKDDMSGGAAVIGTLRAASALKLPLNLVGIVPATDNMPGSHATKPGDVLHSYAGLTVEVVDTDAEGRLVLADGLAYAAREFKPRAIVDLATLTGSCYVALGSVASGLFTEDNRLAKVLFDAGEATGERIWRLPLWPEHEDLVKSDIADVKNIGVKGDSDCIAAATFLKKFAGGVPWAHLDIAGTSWADKKRPYVPKGGTGVGVRLLIHALRNGL
jgi:leucyl aminopeptidase